MQTKYKITKDLELVLTDGENLLLVPDIFNKVLLLKGRIFVVDWESYSLEDMSNEAFRQFCGDVFYDDLDFLLCNEQSEWQ